MQNISINLKIQNIKLCCKIIRNVHTRVVDNVKPFKLIPRPFQIPLLGNWHLYKIGIYDAEKYHEVLRNLYERYGPLVYEKIGLEKPIIHVFDPDDVETVYRNEDKIPKIFPLSEFTKKYRKNESMSPGLGNTNGEDWYRLVNGIRHVMIKNSNVLQFLNDVDTVTDDLIMVIRRDSNENGEINLRNVLGRWTQEATGKICFDKRLEYLCGNNEDLGDKIVEANATVFRLSTLLKFSLPFYNYINTPKWKKFVENERIVHDTTINHVNEALEKIEQNAKNKTQTENQLKFLLTLLQKEELSRNDVKIITTSLFIDALSTTVPTLINNLFALATNPRVQDKAYKEICEVSNNAKKLEVQMLNKLRYLKAVIKETFRMYPNGTEIARITKKPLILSNYRIPAESHLSLNLLVHFKNEKYFSEPDTFKPERWLRGTEDANIHPFLLTPFGYGARTCAGRKFAEQDLCVSIFKILKHFRLSYPASGPPINFVFNTLIFPTSNLSIQFIPR